MSAASRFTVDGILLAAFIAAYNPSATGLTVHEWLSLGLVFVAIFHTALNWDWVVHVTTTFLDRIRAMSRVNLFVDLVLFVATVTVMLSGFLISRVLGAAVGLLPSTAVLWHTVHSVSADVTVVAFTVHALLHWRWIVNVMFGAPSARAAASGADRTHARHSQMPGWTAASARPAAKR
jgi:hypothetical protein